MSLPERETSIDAYRGLAIVLMVAANFLAGVDGVPPALKHASDVGLTVIDLVAPMFITAIGLTVLPSFAAREATRGRAAAVGHHVGRYLAIAGIGALLSAGEDLVGQASSRYAWGVLQAIGIAGLLVLPLAWAPWWARLAAAAAVLAIYQLLLDRYWLDLVLASSHGGLPGTLGWFSLLALVTVLGPHLRAGGRRGLAGWLASAGTVAVGLALALVVPVSKNRVSSSYVLISAGISCLAYSSLRALLAGLKARVHHLEAWGRNPLLLYLLHYVLLAVVVLPGIPRWYTQAPVWLTLVQLAALLGVLGLVARALARREIVVRL